MSVALPANAFSAGVLSPAFYGRIDLDKYDLGLAEAINFFINFRGGVSNRPGTEFLSELSSLGRIFTFRVSEAVSDYILIFQDLKLSIYQEGLQVLLDDVPVELTTPWTLADLEDLKMKQRGLTMTVTSRNRTVQELTLAPETGIWTLEEFSSQLPNAKPGGLSAVPSDTGEASFVFRVTAVDADGVESLPSRPYVVTDCINYTVTAGSVSLRCNKVEGAVSYRFYRSIVSETTEVSIAQDVGYIGESQAPQLTDANIQPDYTQKPPIAYNPFADRQVLNFNITAPGTGYLPNTTTLTKTFGPGSGLDAYPVVVDGEVIGVLVDSYGRNFNDTSVFEIGGAGTGATIEAVGISPSSGNDPSVVEYFQQRRILAATNNLPNGIWGSQPNFPSNFSSRRQPLATDSYNIFPDLPSNNRILHMKTVRDGLLLFHSEGVDNLLPSEGSSVNVLSNKTQPQTFIGAGPPEPVLIEQDIVYASARVTSLYSLSYTFYSSSYTAQNVTLLASHFFNSERGIRRMAWLQEPDRLLWVLLTDGTLLTQTYFKEQEIFAWAEHRTQGFVEDIRVVREESRDVLYLIIRRFGKIFFERMAERNDRLPEEGWFVDSALATNLTKPGADISLIFNSETEVEITSPIGAFADTNPGQIIRALGGLYEVTMVDSPTSVICLIIRPPFPDKNGPSENRQAAVGEWTLSTPTSVFSGLDHLEGQTVSVLADGDAYIGLVVEDGAVTLPQSASLVVVGLPYTSTMTTLPLATPQSPEFNAKRKRVVGSAIRLSNTRGLTIGTVNGRAYEMKDRSDEDWGDVTGFRDGRVRENISAQWKYDAQLRIQQTYPLAASILGLITETDV